MSDCKSYVSKEDLQALKESQQHIEHVARSRNAAGEKALQVTDTIRGENVTNRTLDGLEDLYTSSIQEIGWVTIDSFQLGADITARNQVLRDETNGEYYRWDGDLPKNVPVGSTPQSSGGVSVGAWVSVGDAALRSELKSSNGSSIINTTDGKSVQESLDDIKNDLSVINYNRFIKKGDIAQGIVLTDKFDVVLKDGYYYSFNGSFPHTIVDDSVDNFTNVGLLNGWPVNDIRNFGAVTDLVEKRVNATDCSDAWEYCYNFCKKFGFCMILPDAPIYVSKPCKAGTIVIRSQSGVAGFADPYYARRTDKTNFIDGSSSANWSYFYNYNAGADKTWFDMVVIAYGCLVCSDKNISILVKEYYEEFNFIGVGVLGNHRQKDQIGIDSGIPVDYQGVRSTLTNVTVVGCGSHGIFFRAGLEISTLSGLKLYANNGAGMLLDKYVDIISPVDYLLIKDCKVDHNRIGGIVLTHARTNITFSNVIGNNSGQYDCPMVVDPLLGYWRNITPTIYDARAWLIDIQNGALDPDSDVNNILNLEFKNIKGEQVVGLIRVNCKTGTGALYGVSVDNLRAVESSKLNTNLRGTMLLLNTNTLGHVTFFNQYSTQYLSGIEVENVGNIEAGTGLTTYRMQYGKAKQLFGQS